MVILLRVGLLQGCSVCPIDLAFPWRRTILCAQGVSSKLIADKVQEHELQNAAILDLKFAPPSSGPPSSGSLRVPKERVPTEVPPSALERHISTVGGWCQNLRPPCLKEDTSTLKLGLESRGSGTSDSGRTICVALIC